MTQSSKYSSLPHNLGARRKPVSLKNVLVEAVKNINVLNLIL